MDNQVLHKWIWDSWHENSVFPHRYLYGLKQLVNFSIEYWTPQSAKWIGNYDHLGLVEVPLSETNNHWQKKYTRHPLISLLAQSKSLDPSTCCGKEHDNYLDVQ